MVRIIRALEVYHLTGKPISDHFKQTASPAKKGGFILHQIGLKLDKNKLYQRIEERVDRMFDQGIVEEVRNLLARGVPAQAPPFRGLGYRQVLKYIKGEMSLEEAIRLTKIETRHYAKRQLTWFKKSPGILWFDAEDRQAIDKYVMENLIR